MLAICEQLIEYERAAAIERRIVAALGRRWVGWDGGHSTLADMPAAERLAGTSPALLQSFDLAGCRALTLSARRAGGRPRPGRPVGRAPRGRLAAAARDPRHRLVDCRDARAARAGPPRPAPGGRPEPAEARRPDAVGRRSRRPSPPSSRYASSSRPTGSGRAPAAAVHAAPRPAAGAQRASRRRSLPKPRPVKSSRRRQAQRIRTSRALAGGAARRPARSRTRSPNADRSSGGGLRPHHGSAGTL